MESRHLVSTQVAEFPQRMRAGERRMSAQVHLDSRSEPPQLEPLFLTTKERRLGQVHLARNALHPRAVDLRAKYADRCRVSRERL